MAIRSYEGEVSYEGAVYTTRERNFYDDSDFYAIVWTGSELKSVDYATTRFGGGGSASADITPENLTLANKWAYNFLRKLVWNRYIATLRVPAKGDEVVVAKGRKVPVGTTGILFWIGKESTYGGYSKWSQTTTTKVGIATSDRRDENGKYADVVWTYLENLKVTDASVAKKFDVAKAKYMLRHLKRSAIDSYVGYLVSPTMYYVR